MVPAVASASCWHLSLSAVAFSNLAVSLARFSLRCCWGRKARSVSNSSASEIRVHVQGVFKEALRCTEEAVRDWGNTQGREGRQVGGLSGRSLWESKGSWSKRENPAFMPLTQSMVQEQEWVMDQEKWNEMLVAQLCLTLCDPRDCSPSESSVYGLFQARILEWVAISFSKGSSWPRKWTRRETLKFCLSLYWGKWVPVLWEKSESAALLLEAEAHWSLGRPGNGRKDPRIGGGGAGRSQTICCSWFAGWSQSATWVLPLLQGLRSTRQLHLTSSILCNYAKVEEYFLKDMVLIFSKCIKNLECKCTVFIAPTTPVCTHKATSLHEGHLQISLASVSQQGFRLLCSSSPSHKRKKWRSRLIQPSSLMRIWWGIQLMVAGYPHSSTSASSQNFSNMIMSGSCSVMSDSLWPHEL